MTKLTKEKGMKMKMEKRKKGTRSLKTLSSMLQESKITLRLGCWVAGQQVIGNKPQITPYL